MKTKILLNIIIAFTLLSFPKINFAQAPDLGTAANFVLFTINGAVSNTGVSQITGDIGTNNGAITGFGAATVIGTIHNADIVTLQCSTDLLAGYNELYNISPTATHIPVLGNGETLFAGVYSIGGAGSVASVLTLDAAGDSNAIFIFKIGGAFTTAASTTVTLLNGALAHNIFWIAEGAIAMAASTNMKGTLISHNGAISMAAGGTLHGRMFSTTGAVSIDAVSAVSASILLSCPIVNYQSAPNLGSLANFTLFTVSGAIGNTGVTAITGNIGSNAGAITGFGAPSTVNGNINIGDLITAQCITDLQAAYSQLSSIPVTNSTHTPTFGSGETLFAGVYSIGAAASVAGTLTLDAQGDPNAIFIFKIGGAFTTGASTTVNLTNGASACNVFWVAEGAIAMATLTIMKGTLIAHPGAVSMGAGGMLEGRMLSTTGAVSVYAVSASIPTGCSVVTSWTGAAGTTDWFTTCNWDRGVPNRTIEAVIPTILMAGRFYPVINSGAAAVDSVTIQNAATLTVNNSNLQVHGAIVNNGIMNAANGTIEMNGSSSQVIAGNTFENNALNHLIISNSSAGAVSLGGTLNLFGSLTYSGTGMQLTTNDALTLKSTVVNTAWLGDMTGNVITGKVTVERYITARKAWRFLSIPTNTNQTIKEAWQEGAMSTGSNPVTGYGTQVTSNRSTWLAEGFDMFSAGGPSMKTYNDASGDWTGIDNTNTRVIKTTGGYMTFIRGDRTANAFNSIPTETVLRTTGELYTGDQAPIIVNTSAGIYASIGNPYASALDMRLIHKTGLKDFFYVWDPNLGGSFGYGGYQTFSYNGTDYEITPGMGSYGAAGSVSNYIPSGQAFLVQATAGGGSLSFTEEAKAGGIPPASIMSGSTQPQLRTSLYGVRTDNSVYMIDGVLNNYGDSYSNNVDDMDATKSTNNSENLSIKTANTLLVVERRNNIEANDTIFLHLSNMKMQQYRFEITADHLNQPTLTGFLEDSYLHTSTALNLVGNAIINFNITNIPASYAPGRFRIVLSQMAPLPVRFTSIKAFRQDKHIQVEWKVANEVNISRYEVERSNNGTRFNNMVVIPATANGEHFATYLGIDTQPVEGYNYYRVRAVGLDGNIENTNIVKVMMEQEKQEITIYPNPVIDDVIRIQFKNMPGGKYSLKLFNNNGQEVLNKMILHKAGNSTAYMTMDKNIAHGIYQLEATKPAGDKLTMIVVY